jgi:succinate-semialdehyde dehydrogenase/glutarate-semialdehyde dehydrogenase
MKSVAYPDTQLFIAGVWQDAAKGRSLPVHNPASGQEIGRVAHADRADLDAALEAAQRGFEIWRDMTPAERSKIMRKAAGLMRDRANDIASLLTQEQGKPLVEARGEALAAADIIEWFAEEGFRVYGRLVPHRTNLAVRQIVVKDPVGPVAAFTPWNFPINQVVRKIAAGLACGCSLIVKAPEETPASPAALIRAFQDAGLPEGVLGLVFGDPAEISEYLIASPIIRKITFTGIHPGGQAAGQPRRQAHEARVDGARRACAGYRVRGCRRGARGAQRRCGQVSQCGAGLHLADAVPRSSQFRARVR